MRDQSYRSLKALSIGILCWFGLIANSWADCGKKPLVVAWEDWPPYQYKDKGGKITGLDNDIVLLVGKEAGCEIKLKSIPWKTTLKHIKAGKIHIALGASKTAEREVYANFSPIYRPEVMDLFVTILQYYNKAS